MGEYIETNKNIKSVNLSQTYISDQGVELISNYLIGNIDLDHFTMVRCDMVSDHSVPVLLDIAKMSHLKYLEVTGPWMSHKGKQMIKDLIEIDVEKRYVPIKSNSKSAAKATHAS